ncbi:MAG: response regulator [Candidatus Abyssobacteria bacterium SURF_17]|uniref:Response regulator n=1 Tax=Candidatus Abyssobacteria bacterium SURF_17 TaxID=2093361 RepID=A0A419ER63_9BACT|nr:MAG: response regulator [Candidatus Abyssubacteria bacterium SURF_17]
MTRKGEIFVVDDDSDMRRILRDVLEKNGYAVQTAKNGSEAREMLKEWRPDLILMDLMMATDTEGFDVACMLRNNPEFANTPIIMITCFLDKVRMEGPGNFQRILGEEWPADWLFEKPVDTKKLLEKIQGILRKS